MEMTEKLLKLQAAGPEPVPGYDAHLHNERNEEDPEADVPLPAPSPPPKPKLPAKLKNVKPTVPSHIVPPKGIPWRSTTTQTLRI